MIRIFTLRSRFWISKHLLASETLIMLLGIDRMNLRDVIIWIFLPFISLQILVSNDEKISAE